jgi:acyl-CoA synthetase (AMP-forming)/AMP-acid ligase II
MPALDDWLAEVPDSPTGIPVDPGAPCAIMYTSGTTGRPKGVLLPHRAYFRMYLGTALETGLSRDDRYLMAVPMFHAAGLNLMLHQCLFMGASGVIHRGTLEPPRLLALIEREKLSMAVLVPPVIGALARHPARHDHDLSSLRTVYYGSMPMPPTVLSAARAAFPQTGFHQIYGSTESGLLGVLPWRDHETRADCTGREALFSHLRIIDGAGAEVGEGEIGEVVGAASGGMLGYWRNAAATAAKMRDGWIHTGDLARREGDGYFTLVGRLEEVIASGGEKIHPGEVEQVLASHPAVREVAVFGVPDDTFGETVGAAVVLHAGMSAAASALDAHCLAGLASYKRPRHYLFLETLPRNASEKIQRAVLRERLLANLQGNSA